MNWNLMRTKKRVSFERMLKNEESVGETHFDLASHLIRLLFFWLPSPCGSDARTSLELKKYNAPTFVTDRANSGTRRSMESGRNDPIPAFCEGEADAREGRY
jgi:hypothetical protein